MKILIFHAGTSFLNYSLKIYCSLTLFCIEVFVYKGFINIPNKNVQFYNIALRVSVPDIYPLNGATIAFFS